MRGNAATTRVHYKGSEDDYVIFVDSPESAYEWRKDKSIPLAQVVNGWKIFVTHKCVLFSFLWLVFRVPRLLPSRWGLLRGCAGHALCGILQHKHHHHHHHHPPELFHPDDPRSRY